MISKAELVTRVAAQSGFTKKATKVFLEAFTEVMIGTLIAFIFKRVIHKTPSYSKTLSIL